MDNFKLKILDLRQLPRNVNTVFAKMVILSRK